MAHYQRDDGICLRVTDFSETSQIVGMFTRRHGLVPLIAKGSKRGSKRNVVSGPLDLLTSGEVVFVAAREMPGSAGGRAGTRGRAARDAGGMEPRGSPARTAKEPPGPERRNDFCGSHHAPPAGARSASGNVRGTIGGT